MPPTRPTIVLALCARWHTVRELATLLGVAHETARARLAHTVRELRATHELQTRLGARRGRRGAKPLEYRLVRRAAKEGA